MVYGFSPVLNYSSNGQDFLFGLKKDNGQKTKDKG
jgi:hypothetical protein